MNTKAYYDLSLAKSVGAMPAALFERIKNWCSFSELVYEGKTFCFRTQEQLAEEIGASVSAVKRYIALLIKLGFIVKKKLKASQWNQVNCYALGSRFDVPDDTENWPDREDQSEPIEQTDLTPSNNKNSIKKEVIKKAKAVISKTRAAAKGFGEAFRGGEQKDSCKACKGTGILNDKKNFGYRCLCPEGKAKSPRIPKAAQQLFQSLGGQIGLSKDKNKTVATA